MTRIYLDASVIIAAMLSTTGGSAKLLKLISLGKADGIISQTVIEEVKSKQDKISLNEEQIGQFIKESTLLVRSKLSQNEIKRYEGLIDPSDAHLIAGAKLTNSDFLVSLDKKHILNPEIKNKFPPLKIASPKEMLEEIVKD